MSRPVISRSWNMLRMYAKFYVASCDIITFGGMLRMYAKVSWDTCGWTGNILHIG
jgi:hypothetical protein